VFHADFIGGQNDVVGPKSDFAEGAFWKQCAPRPVQLQFREQHLEKDEIFIKGV
jgi:hypothetical protein